MKLRIALLAAAAVLPVIGMESGEYNVKINNKSSYPIKIEWSEGVAPDNFYHMTLVFAGEEKDNHAANLQWPFSVKIVDENDRPILENGKTEEVFDRSVVHDGQIDLTFTNSNESGKVTVSSK